MNKRYVQAKSTPSLPPLTNIYERSAQQLFLHLLNRRLITRQQPVQEECRIAFQLVTLVHQYNYDLLTRMRGMTDMGQVTRYLYPPYTLKGHKLILILLIFCINIFC